MINIDEFVKRLDKIIQYYGLSAAAFAEKVGVQRSSISHILSGRNKPSLEFILRILSSFPEVDMYWLLNGKGVFPKSEQSEMLFETPKAVSQKIIDIQSEASKKNIKRIVIFYSDGTFESFES